MKKPNVEVFSRYLSTVFKEVRTDLLPTHIDTRNVTQRITDVTWKDISSTDVIQIMKKFKSQKQTKNIYTRAIHKVAGVLK